MTPPADLDRQLRKDLADSVSDIHADALTVQRLIDTARGGGQTVRGRRGWFTPLLTAAAVIAIVVVTVAVTSSGKSGHHRPSPVPPAHSITATVPTPNSPLVLGPDGLGRLRLGMTRAQALASGEVTQIDPYIYGGDCALIHLAGSPIKPGAGDGYLSKRYGIVAIFLPTGTKVKTPEGIGVGSSIAAVERAYPGIVYNAGTRQDGGPRATVPGRADDYYTFSDGGTGFVQRISLVSRNQGCFD